MRYLYTTAVYLYSFAVYLASLFLPKAKQWIAGRKGLFETIEPLFENDLSGEVVWFHAASLGEFEQGRPIIEAYRKAHSEAYILLTFFSPSGYEIRKNYPLANLVCYLPADTPRNARRFVAMVKPKQVFFIKYEFWYNYLSALSDSGAEVYQISMISRPKQYLFSWYGSWFRKQLRVFTHFFVQDKQTADLLGKYGFHQTTIAGDTRFDRVADLCVAAKTFPDIETFIDGRAVLVLGSSWQPDEQLLALFAQQHPQDICYIIVPHEIHDSHLQQIERLFPHSIRYSALSENNFASDSVLIVDTIGMLSGLYRYATLAYIGGGFGKGIHNVLEAATFGVPSCFGPNYTKFNEARALVDQNGAFVIHNAPELAEVWQQIAGQDKTQTDSAAHKSRSYVANNVGATKKILSRTLFTLLGCLIVSLSGCSPYKHIAQDDYLLSKNKVKVESETLSSSDFYNLVKQDPNSTFLGMKIGMYVYSLSSRGSDKSVGWIDRNVYRRLGEAPVAYQAMQTKASSEEMRTYLLSKGCFEATVRDTMLFRRKWYMPWQKYKRRVEVQYYIEAGGRYKVENLYYHVSDSSVLQILNRWKSKSAILVGDFYDENHLKQERSRIAHLMKQNGYYAFSEENISFDVDTTQRDYRLDIHLKIDDPITLNDSISVVSKHKRFRMRNTYILPEYNAASQTTNNHSDTVTVQVDGLRKQLQTCYFIRQRSPVIREKVIAQTIFWNNGSIYNPEDIERTYSELTALKNFRYVDISLTEVGVSPNQDTLDLDCFIRLQRDKRHSLTNAIEGNYSANVLEETSSSASGTFGMEWKTGYQHRNLFRGAEIFSANIKAAMEVQSDFSQSEANLSFWNLISGYEFGGDIGLEVPRFLFPYGQKLFPRTFRPHTTFKMSYNTQRRSYFDRDIASASYGYMWRPQRSVQHLLFPVELNFVRMNITNDDFKELIRNYDRRVLYQYTDHLVMDIAYSFIFNNKDPNQNTAYHYFRWNGELAGNLFQLYSKLADRPLNDRGQYEMFRIPYAQYVRTDVDYRRYIPVSEKQTLVLRLFGGIGVPYGNASALPYEKSFFSGGANNLRAWSLRQLGPGISFSKNEKKLDRTGDITMGANAEYRFPMGGILEGAFFADAGNIWLLQETSLTAGGKFAVDKFWKEFGVGVGFGLRLNISFFILRVDLAVKAWDPSKPIDQRWVLDKVQFKDIVPHFGINYPF